MAIFEPGHPGGPNIILRRMLSYAHLPRFFNKDQDTGAGISLLYNGTEASASVFHRHLMTSVVGGAGGDLDIVLGGLTLGGLVAQLNAMPGYTAQVMGNPSQPALTLVEFQAGNIVGTPLLMAVFGSLLWMYFSAISWTLLDCRYNQAQAFAELYVLTADGKWLDMIGQLFGRSDRIYNDTDYNFARRIIEEAQRPRLNHFALENLELALNNAVVSISDRQADVSWIMGQPLGQAILQDYDHALGQFIVSVLFTNLFDPSPITVQQAQDWNPNPSSPRPLVAPPQVQVAKQRVTPRLSTIPSIPITGDSLGRLNKDSAMRVLIERNRAAGIRPIYDYPLIEYPPPTNWSGCVTIQPLATRVDGVIETSGAIASGAYGYRKVFRRALFIRRGQPALYPFYPPPSPAALYHPVVTGIAAVMAAEVPPWDTNVWLASLAPTSDTAYEFELAFNVPAPLQYFAHYAWMAFINLSPAFLITANRAGFTTTFDSHLPIGATSGITILPTWNAGTWLESYSGTSYTIGHNTPAPIEGGSFHVVVWNDMQTATPGTGDAQINIASGVNLPYNVFAVPSWNTRLACTKANGQFTLVFETPCPPGGFILWRAPQIC